MIDMAPKRQRCGSSTHPSSDEDSSGDNMEKFSTPEAQSEFNRLMSRSVAKERWFLPITHVRLVRMIRGLGWEGFCEAPSPVPLSVVREIYANAKAEKMGFVWFKVLLWTIGRLLFVRF